MRTIGWGGRPGRRQAAWRRGRAPALLLALLASVAHGSRPARAQENPTVVVTQPGGEAYRAAVQRFPGGGEALEQRFREEIGEGLAFSGLFAVIRPEAFLAADASGPLGEAVSCADWRQIGSDALVKGLLRTEADRRVVDFEVWDVARCKQLLARRYNGPVGKEDALARRIADEVVGAFTGRPGVSSTEIAFISDRSGEKELYVMDADGGNVRQATRNRTINEFPSWGPDGDTLLYTSYRERIPGLFVLARAGRSPGRIFRNLRPGDPQYRGVIDPSGRRVAVVISVDGSTKIFVANRDGSGLRQLTRGGALEVSPSWSPDGSRIAFISDRSGAPQVYVMDAGGGNVERVSFHGGYNTGASWSPDGRWIAYESRVGGSYDIWIVDPETRQAVPVVQHGGNDVSPSWSPDGRKLVFSSNRRGRYDLYAVDVEGGAVGRLTEGQGDDTSPAWGPYRPELR